MQQQETDFARAAAKGARMGFAREVVHLCRQNKKWWLLPIVVILLVFGLLTFLSGTAAAPFIYTLF